MRGLDPRISTMIVKFSAYAYRRLVEGRFKVSEWDPLLKETRAKLLTILGDERLTDEVLKIVRRAVRQAERRERAPQWREKGKFFY